MYILYNFCFFNTSLINIALFIFYFTAITVRFTETMYSVNEGAGPAQIGVELSGESASDTVVQVFNTDGSATGEYCSILINY